LRRAPVVNQVGTNTSLLPYSNLRFNALQVADQDRLTLSLLRPDTSKDLSAAQADSPAGGEGAVRNWRTDRSDRKQEREGHEEAEETLSGSEGASVTTSTKADSGR
jgi:hypothetical protein